MIGIVKIYRNKTHASISLIGLLSWFFSFSLQSCSIRGRELNIDAITIRRLQENLRSHVSGCIPRETRAKFQRLEQEGFLGTTAPDFRHIQNNNDVRKHFMFLFYNCLLLKEPGVMFIDANARDRFVADFRRVPGNAMLFWTPIRVNSVIQVNRIEHREYMVEFRIRELVTDHRDENFLGPDDSGNMNINMLYDNRRNGQAPRYLDDIVEIDHLFRDSSVTVELPRYLHNQKTMLIDNLMRVPTREQINQLIMLRQSRNYWMGRYRRGIR